MPWFRRTPDAHEDEVDPLRRVAQYRVDREAAADAAAAGPAPDDGAPDPDDAESPTEPRRAKRMDDRALWVDTVIDQAIRRGEFDDLPGRGKPIPGIGGTHDPDWWLKNLVERENITGVLPAAQLRKDDAELDGTLDREHDEQRVRRVVADFNARVIDARRQLMGGPPVVTKTRDAEREVARWRERRRSRGIR
jgi:hypothetical protein